MERKIFLTGFMGSGKTFWGKKMGFKLSMPFYDLDEEIVKSEGMAIVDIFSDKGEDYFRKAEQNMLHTLTGTRGPSIISCGGGTPCYEDNMDFMNKHGVTVWFNVSFDKIISRLLLGRDKRPLIKNMQADELRNYISTTLYKRVPYYSQAQVHIQDDELELNAILKKIFP